MKLRQLFESSDRSVGIIFGRFNPPHQGHKAAWEMAAHNDHWFVGTNKSTEGPKDPLPYAVKTKAMLAVMPELKGHIIPETSWLTLASKVYKEYGDITLNVYTDEDWVTKTLIQYNGVEGPHGLYKFKHIEQRPTPRLSSATALRAAVQAGDRDAFAKAAGVDANTPVGGKPFFDVVAHYLLPYASMPKKAPKKVKQPEPDVAEGWKDIAGGAIGGGIGGGLLAVGGEMIPGIPWGIPTLAGTALGAALGAWRAKALDKPVYQVYVNGKKASGIMGGNDAARFITYLASKEHDTNTKFAIVNTKTDKIVFRKVWSTSSDDTGGDPNWVGSWDGKETIDPNVAEDNDPCWKDYKQIGMKTKGGKQVPNCVPKESTSNAMSNTAKRLTDPSDGKTAKLRAAGDKRREDQLKGRDMAKRDRTSKDEWGDFKKNLAELSSEMLGRYKKAASADASKADKAGDFEKGNKRFKGIVKATNKQFDNDMKGKK